MAVRLLLPAIKPTAHRPRTYGEDAAAAAVRVRCCGKRKCVATLICCWTSPCWRACIVPAQCMVARMPRNGWAPLKDNKITDKRPPLACPVPVRPGTTCSTFFKALG